MPYNTATENVVVMRKLLIINYAGIVYYSSGLVVQSETERLIRISATVLPPSVLLNILLLLLYIIVYRYIYIEGNCNRINCNC